MSLLGGVARDWGRSLDCGPLWFKSCVALAWDREPVGCRLEYGKTHSSQIEKQYHNLFSEPADKIWNGKLAARDSWGGELTQQKRILLRSEWPLGLEIVEAVSKLCLSFPFLI